MVVIQDLTIEKKAYVMEEVLQGSLHLPPAEMGAI